MKEKEEREKETTMISILVFMMATFKSSLKQYFLFAIIYNWHRLKMLIVSEQFR